MIQQKMARHHGGGSGDHRKAPTVPLLLWWSGTTATFMFVIVLRTHLAVVSRFQQPNKAMTMFSSGDDIGMDDFAHNNHNSNNNAAHSIVTQLSRHTSRRNSNKAIETKRPTGRFSNTWSFTAEEQQVVAPMAAVFGASSSSWDELHGKKCQRSTYDNLSALQEYISSLDLYIVSHGGLGSNALMDHLDAHTSLKVKVKQQQNDTDTTTDTDSSSLYHSSCHLGNPAFVALVRHLRQEQHQQQQRQDAATGSKRRMIPPTLVIVGDFWNAFQSMKRRTWLNMNIAKNLYGSQACRSKWENSLPLFPTDPAGIKMMMLAHIVAAQQQQQQQQPEDAAPIVFLQAPYTRESIVQALQLLFPPTIPASASVERHLDGFQVRQRGTQYKTVAAAKQVGATSTSTSSSSSGSPTPTGQEAATADVDPLLRLYQPYEALEDILTRMPRAWMASDTPRELLDYLVKEFSMNDMPFAGEKTRMNDRSGNNPV
jgi:hypothetical protein